MHKIKIKKSFGLTLLLASILYLLIALIMFFPMSMNIGNVAPGSGAAAYTNLWSFWWANYAIFNPGLHLFYTNMLFYPVGVNLSLQPLAPLTSIVFGPLSIVSTAFAYNIAFFFGFMLSGIAMLVFAFYITKNIYGAFIAGIIFSFSAIHIAGSYNSISLIFIAWIPLFAYFLMRTFDSTAYKGSALLMVLMFLLAAFMGGLYQAILLEILFIFICIAYAMRDRKTHNIGATRYAFILVLFAVASLFANIIYMPIFNSGIQTEVEHMASASIASFFVPSYYNGILHNTVSAMPLYYELVGYRCEFIGYVALLLSIAGIYAARRSNTAKLLAALALLSGWLALGPLVTLNGSGSSVYGLYALYSKIPYFNIMQEPYYFDVLTVLAIAVLASFGVKFIADRFSGHHAKIAFVIIAALLLLVENNGMPLGTNALHEFSTHIMIPSSYSMINTIKGNFSVLVLPSIVTGSSINSALYASEASFYTSIMHKPLIGGYSEDENFSDLAGIYDVPLAMQAANLAYFNSFSYSSPVLQNFTNQTLLSLYNYGTALIVLNKAAYNSSSFSSLASFMINLFGEPLHYGSNTIVFYTSSAINASIYKSFVAYPVLSEWEPVEIPVNASPMQLWLPYMQKQGDLYGAVTVYAPYSNNTNIAQKINSYSLQYIGAHISFDAYSFNNSRIAIGMLNGNKTVLLGAFNTTMGYKQYMLNTTLASGPYGNVLFFITSINNPVYVRNITFTKR